MRIHLIGAGGAGLSALGMLYLSKGYQVTGSDTHKNLFSEKLSEGDADIAEGHSVNNLPNDTDLVVYSNAILKYDPDNIELRKARNLGIETLSYPEALGRITKQFTTVAVAGTHGKTTTTAMLLHILIKAGLSPSGIVGSLLSSTGSNYVKGESTILVIEADEYMKAFLNHSPTMIGVTNIDHDHHDIYPDLKSVQKTFQDFAKKLPEIGVLSCSAIDQLTWDTFKDIPVVIQDYSLISTDDLELKVPGHFNRQNAQLAITLAHELGVGVNEAKEHLGSFAGTWRRQEYKGKTVDGKLVYDDYAHHPTEIRASLSGFRELYPDKKIAVIFQPHLYSRTKSLYLEFCQAFNKDHVDQVILLPIYAAREESDDTISSKLLSAEINKQALISVEAKDFDDATNKITSDAEVVITMGAGDVTELSDRLVK